MTEGAASSSLEPQPANPHLDQWIEKAAAQAVHLPAMWRALKASELHTIVPCDPESSGELEIEKEAAFAVITLEDETGNYAPVFTHLEQAEETCAGLGGNLFGIASLEASVLFEILANAGHRVVINPFSSPRISITAETVRALASGRFSAHRQAGNFDRNHLIPIPPSAIPMQLLLAVRGFCSRRRGLSRVYLCHPLDPVSLNPNSKEYLFFLRMSQLDEQLCKDFRLAAAGAVPTHFKVACNAVLDSHADTAAFLEHAPTIWPV